MSSMQPNSLGNIGSLMNTKSIKSGHSNKQVSLRAISRDDLDEFYIWASDPEVAKYMTWEAYTNKKDALKFLIDTAEKHSCFKAICFKGRVIGSVTLTPEKGDKSRKVELGYVLAREYWGKGLMTAAVIQAIQIGFTNLKIECIEAFVDPKHIASQRILEKAGMKYIGLSKKHLMMGVVAVHSLHYRREGLVGDSASS